MTVIDKLASALNERGEASNQELAKQIVTQSDSKAIDELVGNLTNKDKKIQSDCIKVLYEVGERNPKLIAGHAKAFIALLENKNNRLQWGAMTALDTITLENPRLIYSAIGKIIDIADKGSVITTDHCVAIITKLCFLKEYAAGAFPLLIGQLLSCPANQLPMYAENAAPVINSENKSKFIKTLSSRLVDIEKDTKRRRVEQVIKKLS